MIFGKNILRSNDLSEKLPLIRFGDTWIRISSGGQLFIGIPLQRNLYSFQNEIQNVRLFVIGEDSSQPMYGKFSTWDLATSNHITLEEFISPESNFVVVWKSNFLQFLQTSGRKFKIFILYDVLDDKKNVYQLQFPARRFNLNGDFLTDVHSQLSTGSQQNILSIVTTSRCFNYVLSSEGENIIKEISELLIRLDFRKYAVDTFYVSQEYEQRNQVHFYNKTTTSMWYGTLFSITKANVIKIYSDYQSQVLALIRALEDSVSFLIKFCEIQEDGSKSKLEKCVRDEIDFVKVLKDKVKNQPSTSRGNGVFKVSVKELQRLTDLRLESDLEYKKCEYLLFIYNY